MPPGTYSGGVQWGPLVGRGKVRDADALLPSPVAKRARFESWNPTNPSAELRAEDHGP